MSVEPAPEARPRDRRRIFPRWALLFLAGPTIWYLHFWVVYLAAEAVCAAGGTGVHLGGVPVLSVFVMAVTALAIVLIWWLAIRARRLGGEFTRVGALLGILFALATAFVGLPAMFLAPC